MARSISRLTRWSDKNCFRKFESLINHDPQLSFCWNELPALHQFVVAFHLATFSCLDLIISVVRIDQVSMLVKDKANAGWIVPVWIDQFCGSMVLVLGTLNQDCAMLKFNCESANIPIIGIGAKNLAVVMSVECD